jgi:hypothetical protein
MANRFLNRDYQMGVPSYSASDLGLDSLFGSSQAPTQSPQAGFGPDVSPMASGQQPTNGQPINGQSAGGQIDPQIIQMILQSLGGMGR